MKKIILLLLLFLVSCEGPKTAEEKFQENVEKDMKEIKDELYNIPIESIWEDDLWKALNDFWESLIKNMDEFQVNQLIEEGDDITIPRDILYNISIFEEGKDTSEIEKLLVEKWYKTLERQDIFWMEMFYISKKHPVDLEIIRKDEKEIKSILWNIDWISYDWWYCEKAEALE